MPRHSHQLFTVIAAVAALVNPSVAQKEAQGNQGSVAAPGGARTAAATDAPAPLPRVGVLAYCPSPAAQYHPNNAVNALGADGRFGSVTLVAASETLPSATTLKNNFDCVVAITDLGCGVPMPDAIANSAGDELAGYAGAGGGVVLTAFSFAQPRPSLGLGSAIFAPGLSPMSGLSIYNTDPGAVNSAALSTSPACAKITQGVSGDLNSGLANFVAVANGATLCASYYSSLAAVAVNKSGNVVGFNAFPSSAADQSQPNYRRLFANSVYQACTAESAPPVTATVPVDIKPASCPNVLQPANKGMLPVAILGTADVPVNQIDLDSIRLAGVAPERHSLGDVARPFAPFVGKTSCSACNSAGGDGIVDLELKFHTEKLAQALPSGAANACVVMKLTGKLKPEFGGTAIIGEDVVSLKGR